MNELATQLRQYIDENFLFGVDTDYGDDDSLMDNSIIDSTGVLELIAHLESRYGCKVGDEDLVPENLDSINSLEKFIVRKQASAPVAS